MIAPFDPGAALAQADQRQLAGDLGAAVALYDDLLARAPGYWQAHANRGLALAVIGDGAAACAGFRRALAIEPSAAPALRNLADSLQGKEPKAGLIVARALTAVAPDASDSWLSLGCIELVQSPPGPAGRALRRSLALAPAVAATLMSVGSTRAEARLAWLRRAVASSPTPEVLVALAQQTTRSGAIAESRRLLRRAIAIEPGRGDVVTEMTAMIDAFSAAADLRRWACRAIVLVPESFAAWNNLGTAELELCRLADAERAFANAIRLQPDLAEGHFNRSMPLFLLDRAEEAWAEYEWRWRVAKFERPPSSAPRWTGEPLAGRKLLVHDEQGLGDSLQFSRYLPLLAREHAPVAMACDPRLEDLFRKSFPDIAIHARPSVPAHDLAVPLLNLPRLLGGTRSFPQPPYLALPEPARIDAGDRFRVGLVWAGNPNHPRDRDRSIPLARLRPLLDVPDVAWFSVQFGPPKAEIVDLGLDTLLADLGGHLPDMQSVARVFAGLDLLITVDTASCHLAGGLGLPVWVMLPWVPDWRWGMTGTTTAWYPSMRLFRQPAKGEWRSVIDEVGAALVETLSRRAQLRSPP